MAQTTITILFNGESSVLPEDLPQNEETAEESESQGPSKEEVEETKQATSEIAPPTNEDPSVEEENDKLDQSLGKDEGTSKPKPYNDSPNPYEQQCDCNIFNFGQSNLMGGDYQLTTSDECWEICQL